MADGTRATKRGTKRKAGTPRTEPTLADLYDLLQMNSKTLAANSSELKTISDRMSKMECRLDKVEDRVENMEKQTSQAQSDLQSSIEGLKFQIEEEKRRQLKRDNLIIYGIPEDNQTIYSELMYILSPFNSETFVAERIGTSRNSKGRPIIVRTGNSNFKLEVFNNLKKLKGLHQFKGVSVQHDLTQLQRQEKKAGFESIKTKKQSININPAVTPKPISDETSYEEGESRTKRVCLENVKESSKIPEEAVEKQNT